MDLERTTINYRFIDLVVIVVVVAVRLHRLTSIAEILTVVVCKNHKMKIYRKKIKSYEMFRKISQSFITLIAAIV